MAGSNCKRKLIAVPSPPPSSKRCKCDNECTLADSSIFERSSLPSCVMFYEGGEWKNFLPETSLVLGTAFLARHSSAKFSHLGSRYLLSFIRMLQLNLDTGYCRSIAWTDVTGQRFFPPKGIEGYGTHFPQLDSKASTCSSSPSLCRYDVLNSQGMCRHEISFNFRGAASFDYTSPQSSLDVHTCEDTVTKSIPSLPHSEVPLDVEVSSDSFDSSSTIASSESTSDVTSNLHNIMVGAGALQPSQDFPLLQDKLLALKPVDSEFEEVKKRFLAGLSVLANHTTVTGVSKNCHRSTSGQVRYEAFRQHEGITKRLRGDANIRYAWYGTSKHGLCSLVLHGFGQPKTPRDGAMYGVGIYLAPEKYSNVSAVYSDVDENGEQHVVLCRVIMGNMEQVARGSTQFHPGSEDYDGGVDNLCNPKQYIVWSTHMSTHILPEYIVSFKISAPWQGVIAVLRGRRRSGQALHGECEQKEHGKVKGDKVASRFSNSTPRSPWMSIDMLFLLLKSSLSAESMSTLQQRHSDLKEGRLSSSDFISNVRSIAGDHLVCSTLKSMQTHVLGAVLLQNLLTSGRCQMTENRKIA